MDKYSLKQIIKENPKWNWENLNGLMLSYRNIPISEQEEVTKAFELIKDYIKLYKK